MSVRLFAHWTAVTLTAACTSTVAAIPFTGPAASAVGTLAAAAVCLIGIALAPTTTRKDSA
ncbi:hypothetical protein [Streptomyces sp. S1D4-20]|uniref:hypothetical protein n=1 Tax=Streptomyces sp. S1D4-20 TaxID=2594462 RepID=UPI00116251CD|nr:hypothetical protein [Streptomyces sp. S1D4-20]QDN57342.1 hypothetical protein FNV67_20160 [Streptomyces sp. S1D4-20]